MTNLFASMNVALSALFSQQTVTSIIEQNVANSSTSGYHRQQAYLTASQSITLKNTYYGTGAGEIGTGVYVSSIKRYSNIFYDARYRLANQDASKWSSEYEIISAVETTLNETDEDDGLLAKLDNFFSELQEANSNPTDTSVRQALLDSAKDLASSINTRYEDINSTRENLDETIEQDVDEINQLATQIANLNKEISRIEAVGDSPNDLLDARDVALDRLSELCGATSYEQENGEVTVSINGHILVNSGDTYTLTTAADTTNSNLDKIVWSDGKDLTPTTGELAGIFEARDEVLTEQLDGLNELADALKTEINALHSTGYGLDDSTGNDFFVGDDAGSFAVNTVLEDVEKIALSSASGETGNNDIGLAIYDLYSANTMTSGTATFNEFYNAQISKLGLAVDEAESNQEAQTIVAEALQTQKESISGVDLNEEAANLVKAQKSYEAAAKLISVIDEMLDTVINGMGVG